MLKKLLITGAEGRIGRLCRNRLTHLAHTQRLGVFRPIPDAAPGKDVVQFDLKNAKQVHSLVEECDGIIHLAGHPTEAPWDVIRGANIDGVVNLYEAARKSPLKPRILFASSSHAVGFHEQSQTLDANSAIRPDGFYGVSKAFGESLANMYHDKFGIETAIVRIGTCFPEPTTVRMLSTWLSPSDFVRLIERVFSIKHLGCPVIYGVSDNTTKMWDNSQVEYLGWKPKDNAEQFRERVLENTSTEDIDGEEFRFHGGPYCQLDIQE